MPVRCHGKQYIYICCTCKDNTSKSQDRNRWPYNIAIIQFYVKIWINAKYNFTSSAWKQQLTIISGLPIFSLHSSPGGKKLQTCLKTKTVFILLYPHMFQNNFSRRLDLCELLWYKQKHKDAYQKVIQFYEHQL
jgi:hypothetical protein